MTATNHALSGALIGALLPLPVAIPLAFISHFAMDKIPHFGIEDEKRNGSRFYKSIVYGDIFLALLFAAAAAYYQKWGMLLIGFVAYSPDITLVQYYFRHGHSFNIQPSNGFMKLHLGIQYERPWGIIPEIAVALVLLPLVIIRLID